MESPNLAAGFEGCCCSPRETFFCNYWSPVLESQYLLMCATKRSFFVFISHTIFQVQVLSHLLINRECLWLQSTFPYFSNHVCFLNVSVTSSSVRRGTRNWHPKAFSQPRLPQRNQWFGRLRFFTVGPFRAWELSQTIHFQQNRSSTGPRPFYSSCIPAPTRWQNRAVRTIKGNEHSKTALVETIFTYYTSVKVEFKLCQILLEIFVPRKIEPYFDVNGYNISCTNCRCARFNGRG